MTIPRIVGRLDPGHQTSDPKVASETTHMSTALANGPGAAPRKTELKRRICCAAFIAFPHQVVTWCLKLSHGSRYTPNQRMFSAGSIRVPFI